MLNNADNVSEVKLECSVEQPIIYPKHRSAEAERYRIKRRNLSVEGKKTVLNIYNRLKEKSKFDTEVAILMEVESLTQVPWTTIRGIVQFGIRERKTTLAKDAYRFQENDADTIRLKVYEMYAEKDLPSIKNLLLKFNEDEIDINCSTTGLRAFMNRMEFKQIRIDIQRHVLIESKTQRDWRNMYLTDLKRYREEGRNIVYLDEMWYDSHDTEEGLRDGSKKMTTMNKPNLKKEGIIILHAGSDKGWIEDCLLLSVKHTGSDYDKVMSANVFESWFEEQLLPKLPRNTVIFLDSAPCHSRRFNEISYSCDTKEEIVKFLYMNNICFEETYTLEELRELLATNAKGYYVDKMAEKYGHSVLRLPPYHLALNPFTSISDQLKTSIQRNNQSPRVNNRLINLIKKEVGEITSEDWKKSVTSVIAIEDYYLTMDKHHKGLQTRKDIIQKELLE